MKRLKSVLAVMLLFATSAAAFEKVTIATSGDFAPANLSNAQCENSIGRVVQTINQNSVCGFEVDLMSRVCEVQNLDCQWTLEPFAWSEKSPDFPGILEALRSENPSYDLVVAYLRGSHERLEKLSASGSYIEGFPVVYKSSQLSSESIQKNSKGFPFSKNGGEKIKIGASGLYSKELVDPKLTYYSAEELRTVEIVNIDALEDQIQKLSSGEIDFAYGPNVSAIQFVSQGHISFLQVPQFEKSIEVGAHAYAAKTAKGKWLVQQIDRGLIKLWKSGEYEKIFAKYHIFDSWGKQNGPKD